MWRDCNFKTIENLLSQCADQGYDCVELWEGSLGYGHLVLLAPDDNHWNFEIMEYYINSWSSGHTVRRFKKISRKLLKEIENKENEEIKGESDYVLRNDA